MLETILQLLTEARAHIPADLALAHDLTTQAHNHARACHDEALQKHSLWLLGMICHYRGQYDEALAHLDPATQMITLFPPEFQPRVLTTTAAVYRQLGDFSRAMILLEQAYTLSEQAGDQANIMRALNGLASIHSNLGDAHSALTNLHRAIEVGRALNDSYATAIIQGNMCKEFAALGQFETALQHGIESVTTLLQIGKEREALFALMSLAKSYHGLRRHEDATRILDQAYQIAETYEIAVESAQIMAMMGEFAYERGDTDDALRYGHQALARVEERYQHVIMGAAQTLAKAYKKRGDYERAYHYLETYTQLRERVFSEESARTAKNVEIRLKTEQALKQAAYHEARNHEIEALRAREQSYFAHINQIRNDFIRATSHDLKNPLTRILLNVDMLRRLGMVQDERSLHLIQNIQDASNLMTKLISDILDLLHAEAGQTLHREDHAVQVLLSEVYTTFQEEAYAKSIWLEIQNVGNLHAYYDAFMMLRVMHNLVSNAIKYSPNGGTVTISAAARQTNEIVLTIQDMGMGIPPEDLPHIFDRFYRCAQQDNSHIEGTGIGLAIVKTIIENHGGRVWAESTIEVGTTIFIVLPDAHRDILTS